MKFDPALKDAVRDRAPDGMRFEPAEVEQALRWAYDVRAGGRSQLDHFYRDTPLGDAAAAALAAYQPAAPRPVGPADVVLRVALFALLGMVPTLVILGVLALLARLAGGHVGVNAWGLGGAYLAWVVVAWVIRDRIGLLKPTPNPYAVPAPRGEADPIATVMTDPDLRQRDFERRVVTDYESLPPGYREELQRRMAAADEADRGGTDRATR